MPLRLRNKKSSFAPEANKNNYLSLFAKTFNLRSVRAFTLIELLIVIGIVAVLAVAALLVLNPTELLKQARDSQRLSDLSSLKSALGISQSQGNTVIGSPSTVYVSVADTSPTCANLGLPSLPSGWTYSCVASSTLTKVDGTGWVPVNFNLLLVGTPLSNLPLDPVNSTSSGLYYTYVVSGSNWEIESAMESVKYSQNAMQDGGDEMLLFETGSNLTLTPNGSRGGAVVYSSCKAIKDALPNSIDGSYTINPAGQPFQVYCDMNGGGWTLVIRAANRGDNNLDTLGAYNGTPLPTGPSAKISHSNIQSLVNLSSLNNPIKMDFADISVVRYIWNQCSWTSSANRNKCASWASTPDATAHITYCGSGENPLLNNGNGGEWASNAITWPYQDGICAYNGAFATNPNACGPGNGDAWCNAASWQLSTGIGATGRFSVNIWVR